MHIVLKPDWDIPVQIPRKDQGPRIGHFVGRKAELAVFVNELIRREQGAILVTGYRGVGKTSFVYQALYELLGQCDKDKILTVLVNGNHLESEGYSRGLDPKPVLVNLIRRLYASTQDESLKPALKRDIESLYKKAVSSEFKVSEAIENSRKITKETVVSSQAEIGAQQLSATQIIWIISFMLALVFQIFPIVPNPLWLNRILPLILAFPMPLFLSFAWMSTKKAATFEALTGSAQQLYTMDNSVNNLEFDLEKLHNDLRKEGIKTIYVLDELDKLDADTIFKAIKYFKNLFTLSSAIFVFVGGEDLLRKYQGQESSEYNRSEQFDYRPLEYTYFSSKYFLARPSDIDLFAFLDEIIDNYGEICTDPAFEISKRSLILEAKCDYFDLIQVIKGKIASFNGICPVLNDLLDNETRLEATIQNAVSVLFNDKYSSFQPSRWLENENILRTLYHDAGALLAQSPGSDVNTSLSEKMLGGLGIAKGQLPILAVTDFHRFLRRLGFLEIADNEKNKVADQYFLRRVFDEKIPTHLLFLSQLEEQLVGKIEEIFRIVMNYCNLYAALQGAPLISFADFKRNSQNYSFQLNRWGRDARSTLSELDPIYRSLAASQPIKIDDVVKLSAHADDAIKRLTENVYIFLTKIFVDALGSEAFEITDLSSHQDIIGPSLVGEQPGGTVRLFTDYMDESSYPHMLRETFSGIFLVSNVPNQLVLSQELRYPVIFVPAFEKSGQGISQPKEKYEEHNNETIIGCIVENSISGFLFSPGMEDTERLRLGIDKIRTLLRRENFQTNT